MQDRSRFIIPPPWISKQLGKLYDSLFPVYAKLVLFFSYFPIRTWECEADRDQYKFLKRRRVYSFNSSPGGAHRQTFSREISRQHVRDVKAFTFFFLFFSLAAHFFFPFLGPDYYDYAHDSQATWLSRSPQNAKILFFRARVFPSHTSYIVYLQVGIRLTGVFHRHHARILSKNRARVTVMKKRSGRSLGAPGRRTVRLHVTAAVQATNHASHEERSGVTKARAVHFFSRPTFRTYHNFSGRR